MEAPFQIMVSVVALAAVLLLAMQVISMAQKEDCEQKWRNELQEMGYLLSRVYMGSIGTKDSTIVNLRCPGAPPKAEYKLLLVKDKGVYCEIICGVSGDEGCVYWAFKITTTDPQANEEEVISSSYACAPGVPQNADIESTPDLVSDGIKESGWPSVNNMFVLEAERRDDGVHVNIREVGKR